VIRDQEVIELKGDKQAITAGTDTEKKDFSNQVFGLRKNDTVYLFTDGFADQFGGPNEKKFSYKRLRELLLEQCSYAPEVGRYVRIRHQTWNRRDEPIGDELVELLEHQRN
jgi:serine phosphatase RsbU (regulator of sigma subunit)